ncbi:MAG: hypothetical protein ACRCTD_16895 [Beijerinckiaceae bacterium]
MPQTMGRPRRQNDTGLRPGWAMIALTILVFFSAPGGVWGQDFTTSNRRPPSEASRSSDPFRPEWSKNRPYPADSVRPYRDPTRIDPYNPADCRDRAGMASRNCRR